MTLVLPSSRGYNKGYKLNLVPINRSKQVIFSFQKKKSMFNGDGNLLQLYIYRGKHGMS